MPINCSAIRRIKLFASNFLFVFLSLYSHYENNFTALNCFNYIFIHHNQGFTLKMNMTSIIMLMRLFYWNLYQQTSQESIARTLFSTNIKPKYYGEHQDYHQSTAK